MTSPIRVHEKYRIFRKIWGFVCWKEDWPGFTWIFYFENFSQFQVWPFLLKSDKGIFIWNNLEFSIGENSRLIFLIDSDCLETWFLDIFCRRESKLLSILQGEIQASEWHIWWILKKKKKYLIELMVWEEWVLVSNMEIIPMNPVIEKYQNNKRDRNNSSRILILLHCEL